MPFIRKNLQRESHGFGPDLRELRQLRGYTREALSRLCGIHPVVIAALEEERLQDLTDPEYAERHVRALAASLDGSADFFIGKYRELLASCGLTGAAKKAPSRRINRWDLMVSSRILVFAAFLALILGIGGYVIWQAKQMVSRPQLVVDAPSEGMQVAKSRVAVRGHTDPSSKLTVNSEPVIVGQDGNFSTEIDVPQGLSSIIVEASRRYSPPVTVERHVLFER